MDGRTNRQTDGRKDKSKAYCPLPYERRAGHNNNYTTLSHKSFIMIDNKSIKFELAQII